MEDGKNDINKPNNDMDNEHTKDKELLDAMNATANPYPKDHAIFRIYEKTSPENKLKMKNTIKINALGNVEMMGREFIVLYAAPNSKDILEQNGITYFLDDAAQREAEAQGYTLLDSPEDADAFIDLFIGGNNEKNKKIWNMMNIFGLFSPKTQTGFWGWWEENGKKIRQRSRKGYNASFAILTKTYDDNKFKYGVVSRMQLEADLITKKIIGEAKPLDALNGYPAIVSRPV